MNTRHLVVALALFFGSSSIARAQSSDSKAQVDDLIATYQAKVDKGGTDDDKKQLAFLKKLRTDMDKPLRFPEPIPGEQMQRGIEELRSGIEHLGKEVAALVERAAKAVGVDLEKINDLLAYLKDLIAKFEARKGQLEQQLKAWATGEGANQWAAMNKPEPKPEFPREATLKLLDGVSTDCLDKTEQFRLERLRRMLEKEPTATPIDKLPGNEVASGQRANASYLELVKKLMGDVCTTPAQKEGLATLQKHLEERATAYQAALDRWLGKGQQAQQPASEAGGVSTKPTKTDGIIEKVVEPAKTQGHKP